MSTKKAKALSGATMGMRFMRRKTPTKKPETSSPPTVTDPGSKIIEQDILHNRPLRATRVDMHGISSEIIGRRSFNNFNKSVEETWVTALSTRSQSKFDAKVERHQITDEELLMRYEKYVKGEGEMNNSKMRVIGNLKKKRKRKENESY